MRESNKKKVRGDGSQYTAREKKTKSKIINNFRKSQSDTINADDDVNEEEKSTIGGYFLQVKKLSFLRTDCVRERCDNSAVKLNENV